MYISVSKYLGHIYEKGANGRWNVVLGHEMWKLDATKDYPYTNGPGNHFLNPI